jgi:hypothetical protein
VNPYGYGQLFTIIAPPPPAKCWQVTLAP